MLVNRKTANLGCVRKRFESNAQTKQDQQGIAEMLVSRR